MTITSVSILLCVSDATSRSSVALENQSLAADLKFIQEHPGDHFVLDVPRNEI